MRSLPSTKTMDVVSLRATIWSPELKVEGSEQMVWICEARSLPQ